MFRGKETCKILKQIRQNIASENDIPLVVEECHYKGECRGTCPRCEAELIYLEKELMKRRSMGKKLVLAGLSAGLSWTPMAVAENMPENEVSTQQDTTQNDGRTILIKGTVMDSYGEPIFSASVMIPGTAKSVETDFDGKYSIYVKRRDALEFSALGFKKVVINSVDKIKSSTLDVVMNEDYLWMNEDDVVVEIGCCFCDTLSRKYDNNGRSTSPPLISDEEYRSKDGKRNMDQDIQYHKVYPKVKEIKENVEVKVRFVITSYQHSINRKQSLSNFKIISSDDERFNVAAIKTILRMDGWQCRKRKVNGKRVNTKKTIKIVYRKEELQMLSKQKEEK